MNSYSHSPTSNHNPNPTQDEEQHSLDTTPAQSPKLQIADQEGPPGLDQENQVLSGEQQPGMSLSPIKVPDVDLVNAPPLISPTNNQRRAANKRKKGFRNPRKIKIQERKVQTLLENLMPVPFEPGKSLDFDKYEDVMKRLGLWDFVHIEFDRSIRVDLVAQLVVNYDPKVRGSYVNEKKVMVNRADLSRCFKLPVVKREKGSSNVDEVDLDSEEFSDEAIEFIAEFLCNWVVLHGEYDWEMPVEVSNSIRLVKDGHPEKVDWAGLLWCMVEKELLQGEKLSCCFYASHFQYLIKSQREGVFFEEPQGDLEVEVKEEDDGGEENQNLGGEENVLQEEPNIELTLGQDIAEKEEVKDDDMMDVEECKDDDMDNWFSNGKSNLGGQILQHCDLAGSSSLDRYEERRPEEEHGGDEEEEEEQEEQEEEGEEEEVEEEDDGFEIAPNDDSLDRDGLTGNLIQGMERTQIPFGLPGELQHQSSVDPFASNSSAGTYLMSSTPLFFGHGVKRQMEPEHNMSHYPLNASNKRTRTDGLWDHKSSDFGMCMDQIQQLMTKAKMIYDSKEQAYEESQSCQQHLLDELQQRQDLIEHLSRSKDIEIAKKDDEILRLENELYLMGNLLEGYRKALKDTQKAFAEYRQHNQLPEEPIYKEAPGGLVLSTTEIEKRKQKQEEEDRLMRLILEQKANQILEECMAKFREHFHSISLLGNRLDEFENMVKLLKEFSAQQRVQKCQVISQIDDVSSGNPSDDTELQTNDVSFGNPSDATELKLTDAGLQTPSDVTELQVTDVSLQNPSVDSELQVNGASLQKPCDPTELQGNDASLENLFDATEIQEIACDEEPINE